MNFTEVVDEVLAIVKRPDKLAAIRREVNMAVTYFSSATTFSRDLYEHTLSIAPNEYTQLVPLSSLLRFRHMKYIKRAGTKNYLKRLAASELGTSCDNQDKWYIAGSSINIAMTALAPAIDIAYYQYPPYLQSTAPVVVDYWMLESGWPMIINRASAKVFADIGDDSSAKLHETYARIDYADFFATNEKDIGFSE